MRQDEAVHMTPRKYVIRSGHPHTGTMAPASIFAPVEPLYIHTPNFY